MTALAEIPHSRSSKFPTRVAPPRRAGPLRSCWCLTPVAPSKEARFLMLTWEDDVEVHALRKRGWTISAIARHTGFDRKTVRKYLDGDGQPGVRARPGPDPFDPFVDYVSARLTEDPHLWARTLLDELEELGFGLSYQSLTRNIRQRSLRPVCEACRTATERPNAVIPHAPGDETQWDWLELPNPPEFWGWGKTAHLLVGSLAHSAKWRAALSPSEDQPHLVAGLDRVTRGLGGVSRVWRFARVRGDTRIRSTADGRSSVAVVATAEPLAPVPAVPYPVIISETRTASRQALVSYRGNRYSVPPELAAAQVVVSHPVGGEFVDIATTSGIVVARHRLAADGLGVMVRDSGHVIALDTAAMATAATGRPHRRKERIPPGPAAQAAAAQLLQQHGASPVVNQSCTPSTDSTVIDLSAYERASQNRTIQ